MICILIIDTMPESKKSEIFDIIVHKSEKEQRLRPYLEMLKEDIHVVDLTV